MAFRVLVVEDDSQWAKAVLDVLSSYDCQIDIVFRGYDAIEMLRDDYFDLMILDWTMEDMSGGEVLKQLHRLFDFPFTTSQSIKMPVIVYSGLPKCDIGLPEEAAAITNLEFLQKTAGLFELRYAINKAFATRDE